MDNSERVKVSFKKLGLHIKNLREDRNIKIDELSARTGIRKEYLEKIEKGLAFGVLIERHLVKIAKTFNIELSELLDFNH
jgi:cytoskeletal protein RodZ